MGSQPGALEEIRGQLGMDKQRADLDPEELIVAVIAQVALAVRFGNTEEHVEPLLDSALGRARQDVTCTGLVGKEVEPTIRF